LRESLINCRHICSFERQSLSNPGKVHFDTPQLVFAVFAASRSAVGRGS
jgi:hypothetical protein